MEAHIQRERFCVVIRFEDDFQTMMCDHLTTIAEVQRLWLEDVGLAIPVALLTPDDRRLPDDLTVGEAVGNSKSRTLELRAFRKSTYWLQAFGCERTCTLFEVAAVLTPSAVRREIGAAVGIYIDDFRLMWDDVELDPEAPFSEQGIDEGALLTVDLRVIVKVHRERTEGEETMVSVECFGSDTVGDLHHKLEFDADTVLVTTRPYRRVLGDPLHLCHVFSDLLDLQVPMDLIAEQKVMLAFQPITLDHLRQQLPVALSWTPVELHVLISERFELITDFRLAIDGVALNNHEPLLNQLVDTNVVIQIDILRPCTVEDMWEDPLEEDSKEEMNLYSTQSAHDLFLKDESINQRLFYDSINLTIFGSMIDIFGPISGQQKPVLRIQRDVERNIPMLIHENIERNPGWARDTLIDTVPSDRGLFRKELLYNNNLLPPKSSLSHLRLTEDSLMILDPDKVFVSSDKKLSMHRLAHGSTYGDVCGRMQQLKGCPDITLKTRNCLLPDEKINSKLDLEMFLLSSARRLKTKLEVSLGNKRFCCLFEQQRVSLEEILVNVGLQAEVPPRHLFSRSLFCCGCGRKVSREEKDHQAVPSDCCSVRSLRLTDRRARDFGTQAGALRIREVGTCTSDLETRDKCVATDPTSGRAVLSASSDYECAAASHPPSVLYRIWAVNPDGQREEKTVRIEEGSSCRTLLCAADRQLENVPPGNSPLIYFFEDLYDREGEQRTAVTCVDLNSSDYILIDVEDGRPADFSSWLRFSRHFLEPSAPLPIPGDKNCPPAIVIFPEHKFLSAGAGKLQSATPNDFTDPKFVAALPGVQSGGQFYWQVLGDKLVCGETGEVFEREDIPGGPKWHVMLLLRDGDRVPRCKVPDDEDLCVFWRADVKLTVENGRVRCGGSAQPEDLAVWTYGVKDNNFDVEFTSAASGSASRS